MDCLIKWYIFNQIEANHEPSPTLQLIKRISKLVFTFFSKIRSNQTVIKLSLRSLITTYQQVNSALTQLLDHNHLNLFMANKYTQSNTNTLLMLFNMWVYNDQLATYVAFNLDAFSYFLDSITYANHSTNQHHQHSSILTPIHH